MQQNELEHTSRFSPDSSVLMTEIQPNHPPETVAVQPLVLDLRTISSANRDDSVNIMHRLLRPLLPRYSDHMMSFQHAICRTIDET